MLGDTITFTMGGSGGTARTLNKINQDGYSAEYLERTTTDEVRMFVRHTQTKAKNGLPSYDRHNVEVRQKIFETASDPEINRLHYFVVQHEAGDTATAVIDLVEGLAFWETSANLTKVLNWES